MKINAALRYEIEQTFAVVPDRSTAEELVFICPECGDKTGNRSVNLLTGMTFCWRCGKGRNNKGSFFEWARALGYRFKFNAAAHNDFDAIFGQQNSETIAGLNVPLIQEVQLPRGFTPITRNPKSAYAKLISKMAERKNLNYEDFAEAGVGYTKEDLRWEPFAIFPVLEYGVCAYFQGRTYVDVPGQPTKRFPSRKEVSYGSRYWVYNIDAARKKDTRLIVVVESILNVLSLKRKFLELGWDKEVVPVCVFKHSISQVQAIKIISITNVEEICILYDFDATSEAWQQAAKLTNFKKTTVAEMPASGNAKLDPNDDVEAAIRALERRKSCSTGVIFENQLKMQPQKLDISNFEICS
jgi:hypothetical protein